MRTLFLVTTLLGSALLFLVQPMVARALLPLTGGVPALWNTCVVFFQVALLAGYAWSHTRPRALPGWSLALAHGLLLVGASRTLPLSFAALSAPPERDPSWWVLLTLLTRVAPAFVALSTSAPLLQRWYVRATGSDPAPLVAASNVGSLTALLAYPFVLERLLPLPAQSTLFTALWSLWVAGTAACAALAMRRPVVDATPPETQARSERRAWWRLVALAAVPASMMLGVTTHLTTDVGSFPLLWVVPLALYLGSFVVVFTRTPDAPTPRVVAPYLGLLVLMFLFAAPQVPTRLPLIAGHLGLFTFTAWLFHGTLARERARVASITSFQLALAVGGALGGAFNALVAPRLFVRATEYPLAMAFAVLLLPPPPPISDPRERQERFVREMGLDPDAVLGPRPPARPRRDARAFDVLVPLLVGLLAALLFLTPTRSHTPSLVRFGAPLLVLVLASVGRRARLALGLVAILAASSLDHSVRFATRTFYGTLRVEEHRGVRRFVHGTTLHGLQYLSDKMRREPVAYYHRLGPFGEAMQSLGATLDGGHIGVVGLGVGMLLAHAHAGQRWTFYELDPAVEHVARTHFTWLRESPVATRVVLGDARRSLAQARGERYRLLLLDAFSSDAIPVHLLTREAMATYLSRLEDDGVLAFHITNRHVRLDDTLAALARDASLVALRGRGYGYGPDGPVSTTWIFMARRAARLGPIADSPRWTHLHPAAGARAWSDAYSDLMSALRVGD